MSVIIILNIIILWKVEWEQCSMFSDPSNHSLGVVECTQGYEFHFHQVENFVMIMVIIVLRIMLGDFIASKATKFKSDCTIMNFLSPCHSQRSLRKKNGKDVKFNHPPRRMSGQSRQSGIWFANGPSSPPSSPPPTSAGWWWEESFLGPSQIALGENGLCSSACTGSIMIQFADNLLPFLFQSVWDWDRASLCQQPDALHWPQVKVGFSHQTLPRFAQGIFIQGLQCVTYSMVGHRSCHDFGEF